MASGSSKGFDFASDDILCSYEDYTNQEQSNGTHSNSAKLELNKRRMSSDYDNNQELVIIAVERSMKKHTDNIMRLLEGLSSRLSQLELYCYNLDKLIGDMRSDLIRDHGESNVKLKFLEKLLQEVHRSVQILRDKQELADTQKELAKLQLARKESSSGHNSRSSTPDTRKNEAPVESHGQQLALVPAPQPPRAPEPMPQPQQQQPQPRGYYLPPGLTQYPPQPQGPQQPLVQSLPQYPQQWTPQVQSQPQVYTQYVPTKPPPVNPSPEPLPSSTRMQMTYSAVPPPGSNQPMTYSYAGPVRTAQPPPPQQQQQQPPQHPKPGFGGQVGEGYVTGGPQNMYMVMYDNASGRVQYSSQGGSFYPPNQQEISGGGGGGGGDGMMSRPTQQVMRGHPYGEVIDKLVSMGYRGEHVMSVIQRLEESGQSVDFNVVLDRLNGHSSGRGWSG